MYSINELANGMRLIHQPFAGEVVYLGLIIKVGSCNEKAAEHGLAHLAEHMLFKGTAKRTYRQIIDCLESVGADINAYTTKEYTFIHTAFLKKYVERAFDVLSDVFFNSSFPDNEVMKEKSIVLDEINYYRDNPDEHIFDDFEELLFGRSALGHSVLGSEKSVKEMNRNCLVSFVNRNYYNQPPVLSSVGPIDPGELNELHCRYFGAATFKSSAIKKKENFRSKSFFVTRKKNTNQAHVILGSKAYSYYHPDRHVLHLLMNILGGPAMNSRLNMILRERYGLCYTIDANYSAFSNAGLVTVYFGTDKKNIDRCIRMVKEEFNAIILGSLSGRMLDKAKEQLKGQIAIGFENREGRMSAAARNLMFFNRYFSLEDIFARIDKIGPADICKVAADILAIDNLSTLIYH